MSTPTVIVAPGVLLREGIASLLQDTRYKVVARAATPSELSTFCCPKGQPTLAIIGIDLQNANLDQVAAGVRLVRSVMPNAKVMLVAEAAKPIDLQRVPGLSVDACIFSLCSRDTLIKVLELTFMDQHVFVFAKSVAAASKEDIDFDGSARVSPLAGSDDFGNGQNLSARESQVLACLAEGKSNKLIARACHISEATVKVHLKAILRKTKAHNRTQAAIWAIQHGFCDSTKTDPAVESNGDGLRDSSNNCLAVESHALTVSEPPRLAPLGKR